VKDQLEGLVSQMVERGILFDEAVGGGLKKRFIKRGAGPVWRGINPGAAQILGIHRNTLKPQNRARYKLDHRNKPFAVRNSLQILLAWCC